MTISRGQMNRQLYMGGGIMNAMPRQQYGLGSFVKKAVKKVTGAVKDVASSNIGKAALLAGAGMYAGGIGPFASGKFGAGFASNLLPSSIGSTVTNMFSKKGIQNALVKGGALAGLSGFLTSQYGIPEEEQEELLSDPSEKAKYLRMYYTNLNPNAGSDEIETFVRENAAMGGRMGYALGGNELPPDPTTPVNPFKPKPIGPVLPNKEMASNEISIDKIEMLIKRGADNDLIKEFTGASDGVIDQIRDAMKRKNKAGGGIMNRMNYALGDTASQNAMQAAGIEGLPVRQNPKGVKELDLRDSGGFIPPVGIKEKEDDIPAMLSNNEFVFTADAVRGMGDGDVELGAQRMYDQMKMLEAGGKV